MARNGFKVFDSDTHVGPHADILERYTSADIKKRLEAWEPLKATGKGGHTSYRKGVRKYERRLGTAEAVAQKGYMAGFTGAHRASPSPLLEDDPAERIKDMDLEGVDVNLTLPSGWFGSFTADNDLVLEMGMYNAYHQWMEDYCKPYPERLGGVILCSARDIAGSVAEIKRWGKSRWAWAIMVYAPADMPLDHPDLEPVWAEAQEHDLAIALHTFTVMPPYAPGGLDNWGNLWLQRSSAHPWCGMRNMASLIGAGIMDRYPRIRIGTLEAGHSWLPFWMTRIDEHAHTIKTAIADLKMKPSEYVLSGRYFQSIEIPEGGKLTNQVIDYLGEDVLMYASDYPHAEAWFPVAVDTTFEWEMEQTRRKKLLWDNACKLYARAGLS